MDDKATAPKPTAPGKKPGGPTAYTGDEMVALLSDLLMATRLSGGSFVDDALLQDEAFKKLYDYVMDLRELSSSLSRGELHDFVYGKGFILSNLKALQSNLRHLTWQTKKVAEGDFSQKVDFLGDFSSAFNEMTDKLKDSSTQMQHLATHDMLTHVPNRLSLDQFFESAFMDAKNRDRPLSVLMIDLDRFKYINDTFGHAAGDKVLINLSAKLSGQLRTSDFFARYGGEEFVAVLPGSDLATAEKIAHRILVTAQNTATQVTDDRSLMVTISVGVSQMLPEDEHYDSIIARSDRALYEAKNNGRNQVRCL